MWLIKGARLLTLPVALFLSLASAGAQTLDELYKAALKEEGTLNCYCTLAQVNASKIFPAFEKRFPGIKINHVDATSDQLTTRAIAEARAGRVLADIFQTILDGVVRVHDQGLFLEKVPPQAEAFPTELRGSYWAATDLIFTIPAWNTNLVKKGEEPKEFDDLADPRWKNRLIGEPRDFQVLIGLTKKFKSEEKAIALLTKIAANNVQFHKGHSQLAELLVAGQAGACVTCYSHHFPSRIRKGAPLGFMLTEGVGDIDATAVFKDAPHPATAWLFASWSASEEGQKIYSMGGRIPAHPKVEPVEKIRPAKNYPVGEQDVKNFPKYEKIWKQIFKLR